MVTALGGAGECFSTGRPISVQASNPPSSGRTFLYPRSISSRAILALVASLGQVQYITMRRSGGISCAREANSPGGMWIAPRIFVPSTS